MMPTLDEAQKEFDGPITVEPWREGYRCHIPGFALAVGDTKEQAIEHAVLMARRETRYQAWRAKNHRAKVKEQK